MGDEGPPRLADAYLELLRHIWVEGAALGASFHATIGESDVTLVVPVAHPDERAMRLGPQPPLPGVTSPKVWKNSSDWGQGVGTGRPEPK